MIHKINPYRSPKATDVVPSKLEPLLAKRLRSHTKAGILPATKAGCPACATVHKPNRIAIDLKIGT